MSNAGLTRRPWYLVIWRVDGLVDRPDRGLGSFPLRRARLMVVNVLSRSFLGWSNCANSDCHVANRLGWGHLDVGARNGVGNEVERRSTSHGMRVAYSTSGCTNG